MLPAQSLACRCGWQGSFLSLANTAPVIVYAEVLEYTHDDNAMQVRVHDPIKGKLTASRLTVWGDNGMMCRPPVRQFPVGSRWLFILNGDGSKPAKLGPAQYAISLCGSHWLAVHAGKVTGNIEGDSREQSQTMPLDTVLRRIRLQFAQ